MSIKTFFDSIFHPSASASTVAGAVAAAPANTVVALKAFAGSEAAKVVAALKETDIGTAVANDVSALTSSTLRPASWLRIWRMLPRRRRWHPLRPPWP